MKKRIRIMQAWLLVMLAVTGIILGIGVALLALNLTRDDKGLTFYGLLCLIVVTGLCLGLPFLTQHRDALVESLGRSTLLFGGDISFMDADRLYKRLKKKEPSPIYAIHARIYGGNEIEYKEVRHALAAALHECLDKNILVAYTQEGDFILTGAEEKEILEQLEAAEKMMLQDEELPSFALLLGVSKTEDEPAKRGYQACLAASSKSGKRPSLSLVEYAEMKEEKVEDFDIDNEERMGRLTFGFDIYEHEGELLAFSNPDLYDPNRGHVQGKDLFHRADIYYVRDKFDGHALASSYAFLKEHPDHKVAIRLGASSVASAGFLKNLEEELKKQEIPADSYYLLVPAMEFASLDARAFLKHARGMGFHVGVYEYGGEDVLTLVKIAPELMTIKPENLRKGASEKELNALIAVVKEAGARLLIEASNEPFAERSDYLVPQPVEEATEEEEVAA